MRSHRALLYAVAGQAGWFVCVLSAARDAAWVGIVFVAGLLALHLRQAPQPRWELRLVVWVVVLAVPWETALIRAGLIAYPHGTLWAGFAPPWLLALWVLFAIQVNVLFRWLRGRWWLAMVLGAVAGPLVSCGRSAWGRTHFRDACHARHTGHRLGDMDAAAGVDGRAHRWHRHFALTTAAVPSA